MNRRQRAGLLFFLMFATVCATLIAPIQAQTPYVPNKLFGLMWNQADLYPDTVDQNFVQNGTPMTVSNAFFTPITPFPSSYQIAESGMTGSCASTDTGCFKRDEHFARFATNGETPSTGHQFQRREAWDYAFDVKIQTPNQSVRKEAGLYFQNPSVGNSMFLVTSNNTFYGTGPGEITTLYPDILPQYTFASNSGPAGDYNHNGSVDAADYVVWRSTLGSTTDLRANGNNDGASMDLIDSADYDTWRGAFGQGNVSAPYHVGDTLRMRLIYTPPVLANPSLPDVANDPNVTTPGKIEYRISLNGGAVLSSGPLAFTNSWQGIPKDTQIMLRVQNLSTSDFPNDSSTVTFNNFDLNGDLPGTGLGASFGTVPEPASWMLMVLGGFGWAALRKKRA